MVDYIVSFVQLVVGSLLFLGIILLAGTAFNKSQIQAACRVFGTESNYETKYVEYTYWSVDCLAQLEDGQWISAFNLKGTE